MIRRGMKSGWILGGLGAGRDEMHCLLLLLLRLLFQRQCIWLLLCLWLSSQCDSSALEFLVGCMLCWLHPRGLCLEYRRCRCLPFLRCSPAVRPVLMLPCCIF